jgi:hypothetical protein
MEPNDQEQERQLLVEVYSNMSDAELKELAADSDDLTDLAYKTLKDEVNRRGLDFDWDAPPKTDIVENRNLITIRKFRDLPEALLAKGLIESASIECFLTDDNLVRLDWLISNAIGNMRLQVSEADAEAAIEILNQAEAGDLDEAGNPDEVQ